MKRIVTLALILLSISGLALAENGQALDTPKAYTAELSSYKVTVVTPLDSKRSVLIGIRKDGQKKPNSFLAEGVLALAISKLAKMTSAVDNSKTAKKYSKEMIQARSLALKTDSAKKALKN